MQNETHGPRTIQRDLKEYYALLGCRLIEMPTRRIGVRNGRRYTIICDEEGLFAEQPKISAIDNLGRPMLVGNLFIVKVDEEGNTVGLDSNDIEHIKHFVQLQGTHKFPRPYPMLPSANTTEKHLSARGPCTRAERIDYENYLQDVSLLLLLRGTYSRNCRGWNPQDPV